MRRAKGPCIPILKGKSKKRRSKESAKLEYIQPLVSKNQELYIDVMHCEGMFFLISVARPIDLTMSTKVPSLKSKEVKKALQNQINLMIAKRFEITKINSDGGLRSLNDFVLSKGIEFEICAAGVHIPIVERKIRVIKERMRSVLFSLPFLLPNSLIPYLVTFVTRTINMIATSNSENKLSPFENLMARKINYNVDLRIYFGMYCQVLVAEVNNSMDQRTTGAIALTQTNNASGAAIFYDLNTKKIIHRDKWTELSIQQDAIDRMNTIAVQESSPPTKNPTFLIGIDQRPLDVTQTEDESLEISNHLLMN